MSYNHKKKKTTPGHSATLVKLSSPCQFMMHSPVHCRAQTKPSWYGHWLFLVCFFVLYFVFLT